MQILVINSAPYTLEFVTPILEILKDEECYLVNYNSIPRSLHEYDGVIISASPKGDDIINKQIINYQWIFECSIPVLGICHGHQMIGKMFGAKIISNGQEEEGIFKIDNIMNNPILGNKGDINQVEHHHEYAITIPEEFHLLAKSDKCMNQAMAHKLKPIFTVQFHAEKHPETLLNFLKYIREHSL